MRRCRCWVLFALVSAASAWASPGELKQVRIAAETWARYTDADGSGMAWDIFRLVYEPVGVKLHTQSMPYTRSVGLAQRGEVDAWVGSYRDEVRWQVFYPRWNYDADPIVALGLNSAPEPTLERLGEFRLAWVRGYEYQRYLPNLRQYREVARRGGILAMLDYGHADFYLDAKSEVVDIVGSGPDPSRYRVTPLTTLPLYLGFTDTARGRALAQLFDQRMDDLVADGSLRPIFERWQQPYPFD